MASCKTPDGFDDKSENDCRERSDENLESAVYHSAKLKSVWWPELGQHTACTVHLKQVAVNWLTI